MEARSVDGPEDGHPQLELTRGARNAVLGAVLLGLFLSALDQTVVGTALPKIVTDLHGNNLYTWVVTSYLLASTIVVPIYGKFSDIYGRKIMLLIGVVIFLAGSALSGLSQDMTQLIIFRGIQGLGAGALFPISLAVIGDLFTPRERGRYQGVFGAVFGLSFIVGPFVGGWITDNISWHWVFYVNLPVGFAALAIIATVLPNFHPPIRATWRELDYGGIVVFTAAIIAMLLGLTDKGLTSGSGSLNSWTDPSVGGLILLGLLIFGVFLLIEARAEHAIIPLGLFKNRTYSASNVAVFMVSFGMFAAIIFLPRYYQAVRGFSATDSGYLIWPLLVGLIGASIVAGFAISKFGRYKLILLGGLVIFAIGSFFMTYLRPDTGDWQMWGAMFLMGLGIGPSMSGFTVVVQNAVKPSELGVATSTLTFLRQIGGSVGLAISGTLFIQGFDSEIPKQMAAQKLPQKVIAGFGKLQPSGGQGSYTGVNLKADLQKSLPPHLQQFVGAIVTAVHDAFSLAIGQVFWLTVWSAIVALIAAFFVKEIPLRGHVDAAGTASSAVPGSEVPATTEPREAQPLGAR